jgi:hypothetical protein
MKRLRMHCSWFMYLIVLVTYASRSWAGACDSITLPTEIKSILEKEFVGWKVVTPELLSPEDRQIWNADYSSECPGIISGHFTGRQVEYAVNLIRGEGKSLEQQFVFFKATRNGFMKVILVPPSHVAVPSVLRRCAPDVYRDPETGRSVKVGFDTIGVSKIESGTVVYYWDGKRFRNIVTSV